MIKAQRPSKVVKCLLAVTILTGIAGAIGLFEPLDDVRMAGIDLVHRHAADGETVIVGVDPVTLDRLDGTNYPRRFDAELIDKLMHLGAQRVFFDRTFSHKTDASDDKALQAVLIKYQDSVFLGQFVGDTDKSGFENVQPAQMFTSVAGRKALNGRIGAFALNTQFPFAMVQAGAPQPIAVSLAHRQFSEAGWYRPDLSIAVPSIPTYSMIDILDGRIPSSQLAGKDIVVGPTAKMLHDFHHILGQGYVPGVYFHAIAAQTLREGTPISLGWVPCWLIGLALAYSSTLTNKRRAGMFYIVGGVLAFGVLPAVLQRFFVTLEVLPGVLAYVVPTVYVARLRQIARLREANNLSGLPSIEIIKTRKLAPNSAVIALKIINYDQIATRFGKAPDAEIFPQLAKRFSLGNSEQAVFQDHRTVVWTIPLTSSLELEDHLEGLTYIAKIPVKIENQQVDIVSVIGADVTLGATMIERIGYAMTAAQDAHRTGHRSAVYSGNSGALPADLALMTQLDAAIDAGELWLAFQPKIDLRTCHIVGAEGLVRWQHPTKGAITPADFIPIAEEQDRIDKLSLHVLRLGLKAIEQIRAEDLSLKIALNISARLLNNAEFMSNMMVMLNRCPVTRKSLVLEITETATLHEKADCARILNSIISMGIDVSIDDYGTGNANLSYLGSIPSNEVKIDRSFITDIDTNITNQILVTSTIEMAHQLDRRVVAEGIEREEELAFLKAMRCDQAQGYLIGKPMPLNDLILTISAPKRMWLQS